MARGPLVTRGDFGRSSSSWQRQRGSGSVRGDRCDVVRSHHIDSPVGAQNGPGQSPKRILGPAPRTERGDHVGELAVFADDDVRDHTERPPALRHDVGTQEDVGAPDRRENGLLGSGHRSCEEREPDDQARGRQQDLDGRHEGQWMSEARAPADWRARGERPFVGRRRAGGATRRHQEESRCADRRPKSMELPTRRGECG